MISNFNPRAPHGARLRAAVALLDRATFQSTRSAWSATRRTPAPMGYADFNPRAPHGARLTKSRRVCDVFTISIHALRMERDFARLLPYLIEQHFNPRAPHGARLQAHGLMRYSRLFQSTRSAWSATLPVILILPALIHFNPRAPHGARHCQPKFCDVSGRFQSTRSAWSATIAVQQATAMPLISIHALRMERDSSGTR